MWLQVSMIAKAITKNLFEKEKEKHKNSAVITYWCSFCDQDADIAPELQSMIALPSDHTTQAIPV